MRTKTYRYGKFSCKTYWKTVGNGFETCFVFNGKCIFVGNFIHSQEANRWWGIMNHEIKRFGKKYTTGHCFPVNWVGNFLSNHLYRLYYLYLDRIFSKYNHTYKKALVKDLRTFRQMKKRFHTTHRVPFLKAA